MIKYGVQDYWWVLLKQLGCELCFLLGNRKSKIGHDPHLWSVVINSVKFLAITGRKQKFQKRSETLWGLKKPSIAIFKTNV